MTFTDQVIVGGSLGGLFLAGWQFLNHSIYRKLEERDSLAQVRGMLLPCFTQWLLRGTLPSLPRACCVVARRKRTLQHDSCA
jgi:hypothetical protein